MSTRTTDRTIQIPAPYMGDINAELRIYSDDGETATIALVLLGDVLAEGDEFRRPQIGRWTWFDAPVSDVVGTFGAFLSHAFEDDEFRADAWTVCDERASDWLDELTMMGEECES